MRLPLPAVAPPAALTIFVIQRCQLLTPQSHSLSPLENLPFKLRRAAEKNCNSQSDETDLVFDGDSYVGDGKYMILTNMLCDEPQVSEEFLWSIASSIYHLFQQGLQMGWGRKSNKIV